MHTYVSYPSPSLSLQQSQGASFPGKLTGNGVLLFLAAVAVAGSGFGDFRPSVFGLAIHPYLIPIGIALPFLLLSRLQRFPANILLGMFVFTGIYIFSTLSSGLGTPETPKIIVGMAVIVCAALLVQSRADFIAGALGLGIAMAILSVRGLAAEGDAAVGAIDLANKNAFSVYALPSILFNCFIALNYRTKVLVKAILLLTAVASLATIFTSENRSGYLGVVVIGLMLIKDRKIFGPLLVVTLATVVTIAVIRLGAADIVQARLERTMEGNIQSDRDRWALFQTSIQIGLENPIIGISVEGLKFELARRVAPSLPYVDPHNVFATVIGGCGLICFAVMLYTGWTIANVSNDRKLVDAKDTFYRQSKSLARMLVILWCARGLFTREILYNPSFCLAVGMVIGLCLVAGGRTRPRNRRETAIAVLSG